MGSRVSLLPGVIACRPRSSTCRSSSLCGVRCMAPDLVIRVASGNFFGRIPGEGHLWQTGSEGPGGFAGRNSPCSY